jgi:hypothetical protein
VRYVSRADRFRGRFFRKCGKYVLPRAYADFEQLGGWGAEGRRLRSGFVVEGDEMRRPLSGVIVLGFFVGCSAFGGADAAEQPPSTPQDNAKPPPVDGSPIAGVYVSTSLGNDNLDGAASRPVKTLKKAFSLAHDQQLRVIACAEVYEENLTLIDGVSAYGYYECAVTPWAKGKRRAMVKAKASPAVLGKGLHLPTRLEGFEVVAPDVDGIPATGRTGTSVALEARDSSELTIGDSVLHGGKGAPGTDGEAAAVNAYVGSPDGVGVVGSHVGNCNPGAQICDPKKVIGALGSKASCTTGSAGPGGNGGDGSWYSDLYYPPSSWGGTWNGQPLVAVPGVTAKGGVPGTVAGGVQQGPGGFGAAGKDGADGANGAWGFDAEGFVIGNGSAGMIGTPGQGGGGGAGQIYYSSNTSNAFPTDGQPYHQSADGGGGGAGGCIGLASKPGTGGGASVGLLVIGSGVHVEGSRIESAEGGRAGRGYLGGAGLTGGKGGLPVGVQGAGGAGGQGGTAGISGHGAPGPSIAMVYAGARPVLDDKVELAPGAGGAGRPEERLVKGATTKILPAVVGEAKKEHQIK